MFVNIVSASALLPSDCDQNTDYLSIYDVINFTYKVPKGRLETMSLGESLSIPMPYIGDEQYDY